MLNQSRDELQEKKGKERSRHQLPFEQEVGFVLYEGQVGLPQWRVRACLDTTRYQGSSSTKSKHELACRSQE